MITTNVVHFQPLAGVNTADLLNGVFRDDPQAVILIQVPLACVVITANDVDGLRGFLAEPKPTVTRDNVCPAFVVSCSITYCSWMGTSLEYKGRRPWFYRADAPYFAEKALNRDEIHDLIRAQ